MALRAALMDLPDGLHRVSHDWWVIKTGIEDQCLYYFGRTENIVKMKYRRDMERRFLRDRSTVVTSKLATPVGVAYFAR